MGEPLASALVEPDPSDAEPAPDADVPAESDGDLADLAGLERDLAAVETALERLDADTYWTDEVTGEPIPDEVLERDPIARRVP